MSIGDLDTDLNEQVHLSSFYVFGEPQVYKIENTVYLYQKYGDMYISWFDDVDPINLISLKRFPNFPEYLLVLIITTPRDSVYKVVNRYTYIKCLKEYGRCPVTNCIIVPNIYQSLCGTTKFEELNIRIFCKYM